MITTIGFTGGPSVIMIIVMMRMVISTKSMITSMMIRVMMTIPFFRCTCRDSAFSGWPMEHLWNVKLALTPPLLSSLMRITKYKNCDIETFNLKVAKAFQIWQLFRLYLNDSFFVESRRNLTMAYIYILFHLTIYGLYISTTAAKCQHQFPFDQKRFALFQIVGRENLKWQRNIKLSFIFCTIFRKVSS